MIWHGDYQRSEFCSRKESGWHVVVRIYVDIVIVFACTDIRAEHFVYIEPAFHAEVQQTAVHLHNLTAEADVLLSKLAAPLQEAAFLCEPPLLAQIVRVQIAVVHPRPRVTAQAEAVMLRFGVIPVDRAQPCGGPAIRVARTIFFHCAPVPQRADCPKIIDKVPQGFLERGRVEFIFIFWPPRAPKLISVPAKVDSDIANRIRFCVLAVMSKQTEFIRSNGLELVAWLSFRKRDLVFSAELLKGGIADERRRRIQSPI